MATDYDFPPEVLDLRRALDSADAKLERLHAAHKAGTAPEDYDARVAELRTQARTAAVAITGHPWIAAAEGGPAAARMALQAAVAAERAEATSGG